MRLGVNTYVCMGRWEPKARERLERAALALFVERGYNATTVADIAERAGLTKSTFFRQFADKREVLFGGAETLSTLFRDAIAAAPADASLMDCLAAALETAAPAFVSERHDLAQQRRAVIAANSELHERALLKGTRLAVAIADALGARGVDEMTARLAAEIGVLAFTTAYTRWSERDNTRAYVDIMRDTLADLHARANDLDVHQGTVRPKRSR